MLVLSRKPGERIIVGENIVITVVRITANNVRLGIDAPRHVNIVREELCGIPPKLKAELSDATPAAMSHE